MTVKEDAEGEIGSPRRSDELLDDADEPVKVVVARADTGG